MKRFLYIEADFEGVVRDLKFYVDRSAALKRVAEQVPVSLEYAERNWEKGRVAFESHGACFQVIETEVY